MILGERRIRFVQETRLEVPSKIPIFQLVERPPIAQPTQLVLFRTTL
jgi:hypothetical protein